METLDLRAHRQSEAAIEVGRFLEGRVPRVLHPGLPSHPQHALAMKQMDATGPIFAFEVEGRAQAHGLLDALTLIDISNNIGDASSEEHTSGPQSQMRISYAVFCLNTHNTDNRHILTLSN